jgi:ATP-binding protein involved in chromosome partitioning
MSWFTPKELPDNKYYIFGEGGGQKMAKMSNSVLLGQVPLVQGIRESGDYGKPAILGENGETADAFMKIAENTLKQVTIRNEMLDPTKKVDLKL